ncbi:NUDIX domain-containing protein [Cellulomonas endophytica]|uniref:NUDIX domain-containing protein n=1 Tax=Cellulomonas endophytica TaxID=2494735 RepID=UPI0010132692|nr:NUDIX hydrolase [Cellulomonas endophytica]
MTDRPPPRPRRPGDGWVECRCGRRHWGLAGAAGLLLARRPAPGAPVSHVVLQHRVGWSDQGGTWGIPGGAREPDETPVAAALREAREEAGLDPAGVRVLGTHLLDHGDWSYTTVLAEEARTLEPAVTDPESLAMAWVAVEDVAARPLLVAFGEAWPGLRARLDAGPGGTADGA